MLFLSFSLHRPAFPRYWMVLQLQLQPKRRGQNGPHGRQCQNEQSARNTGMFAQRCGRSMKMNWQAICYSFVSGGVNLMIDDCNIYAATAG